MQTIGRKTRNATSFKALVQIRAAKAVDGIDYRRIVRRASRELTQQEIAEVLGVSQPAINKVLKASESEPELPEGGSATVTEACQRFAAGRMRREEIVEVLSNWEYRRFGPADEFGEYETTTEGTFLEVEDALDAGFIDEAIVAEVTERLVEKARG